MELLRDMSGRGYPREYLLARIKGRRSYLVYDWQALLGSSDPHAAMPPYPGRQGAVPATEEEVWSGLLRELAWLYSQMEITTRSAFAPLFLYLELRTVILCLRLRLAGNGAGCRELLRFTLLSARVQGMLLAEHDAQTVVGELADLFVPVAEPFKLLPRAYREKGAAGLEELLTTVYLEQAATSRLHPALHEFFLRLIDVRNVITLAKYRRWSIATPPCFIKGGNLKSTLLQEAATEKDERLAATILPRFCVTECDLASANLESLLLSRLTRMVRRQRWESDGIGSILEYLWSSAMQARNLSLFLHGTEIDRDLLEGELIQ